MNARKPMLVRLCSSSFFGLPACLSVRPRVAVVLGGVTIEVACARACPVASAFPLPRRFTKWEKGERGKSDRSGSSSPVRATSCPSLFLFSPASLAPSLFLPSPSDTQKHADAWKALQTHTCKGARPFSAPVYTPAPTPAPAPTFIHSLPFKIVLSYSHTAAAPLPRELTA